jgi:hypothetical protein
MKIKEEIIKEAIKGNIIKQKDNNKNIILEVISFIANSKEKDCSEIIEKVNTLKTEYLFYLDKLLSKYSYKLGEVAI